MCVCVCVCVHIFFVFLYLYNYACILIYSTLSIYLSKSTFGK